MGEPIEEADLIEAAWQAAQRAYAPYSKFAVGAALATRSGRIVTGCNVENASLGLTVCAERAAVCRAVAKGEREFVTLVVCAPSGVLPCGSCRQVLHEFSPDLEVVAVNPQREVTAKRYLRDLLPESFDSSSLDI